MKNIRPTQRLFSPTTGREFFPQISAIVGGASPALVAGLRLTDPGITRVIGRITGEWITAKGEKITVVLLVETSDWDGDEWKEWTTCDLNAVEAAGAKELATIPARDAAREKGLAELAARQAAEKTAAASKSGSDYRPQGDPLHPDKYDGLKAAREWSQDAYRSGDSWSDD